MGMSKEEAKPEDPFEAIREAAAKKKRDAEVKLIGAAALFCVVLVFVTMFDFSGYIPEEWLGGTYFISLLIVMAILADRCGSATADRIVYNTVTYATKHTPASSSKVFVMRQLVGLEAVHDKTNISVLLKELTRPEPEKYESLD